MAVAAQLQETAPAATASHASTSQVGLVTTASDVRPKNTSMMVRVSRSVRLAQHRSGAATTAVSAFDLLCNHPDAALFAFVVLRSVSRKWELVCWYLQKIDGHVTKDVR